MGSDLTDDSNIWPAEAGQCDLDLLLRILEATPGGVMAIDRDWIVTFANRKAGALLGLAGRSLIGQSLSKLSPEGVDGAAWQQYRKAQDEQIPVSFEQYHDTVGDWIQIRALPDKDGLIIIFQRNPTRDEIAAAERAKLRTLEKMSHDLRNGLNSIIGFADLLEETGAVIRPLVDAEYARHIANAGHQLLIVIEASINRLKT
jgi:PAS domain S-box-containing protein